VKLQVLVATMQQKDFSLPVKMNIRCDAIIANQAGGEKIVKQQTEYGAWKMITTPTRGVGLNRNIALMASEADVVLFADDDMAYRDEMPEVVCRAFEELPQADVLIFGPGSLYTSVIPNLLVEEIREAVVKSEAVKIYVCNVMTQPGETDGYGAFEHVKALLDHVGEQFLDYVIVNDERISNEQLKQYLAEGSMPVTPDIDKIRRLGITVVPASLISKKDLVRHEPKKLSRVLITLIYRLRLFGKGVQFFDYIFIRHGLNIMGKEQK
jgi:hypothetical protein